MKFLSSFILSMLAATLLCSLYTAEQSSLRGKTLVENNEVRLVAIQREEFKSNGN